MPDKRQQALQQLAADQRPLPDGEPFLADFYRPEDGYGVTRLIYAVYGDGYPVDTFYIPEQLTEENRAGRIRSVVARTSSGQVASHIAFYRSSPPTPGLYEYGLGLTLPSYRSTLAFARCNKLLLTLPGQDGIDAFFGEAVCNHTITQKLTRQTGAVETAIEPALMPARAYEAEQSADGRVGCVMAFRVYRDQHRQLSVPVCYQEALQPVLEALKLDRDYIPADTVLPHGTAGVTTTRFEHAGVARCTITSPGNDLANQLTQLEHELRATGYALLQCFIPLGNSWGAPTVSLLRQQGFFLGGFLPLWFGEDGILMQKLFVDPEFATMQLHSEQARYLAALVQSDWRQSREG